MDNIAVVSLTTFSGVAKPFVARSGMDVKFAALPSLEILENLFNHTLYIFLRCAMHSF